MTPRDLSLAATVPLDALYTADLDCVPAAAGGDVAGVRDWLLACSARDMSAVPYRTSPGNMAVDGYFGSAAWSARALAAYRMIRRAIGSADRLALDGWILRLGDFHARHINHDYYGIAHAFPARLTGDYTVRGGSAQSGLMTAKQYVYGGAYIPDLALWFNNRRASAAMFVGLAGCWLDDQRLVADAARYMTEWVRYGVTAEGYQGEWSRNGQYGYTSAGITYGATNVAAALEVAQAMHDIGDDSLLDYATADGLFGTESVAPKTIWTPFQLHLDLSLGATVLRGMDGVQFDTLNGPAGALMHASFYLPVARKAHRSGAIDAWLKLSRSGREDNPFGAWRGEAGMHADVRVSMKSGELIEA